MSVTHFTLVCSINGWLMTWSDEPPAYKPEPDPLAEVKVNCKMLERAVGTLSLLSPGLKFVAFPSGTKVKS